MTRASVIRASLALAVAVASLLLAGSQMGFVIVAGGIGVLVGVPGAAMELLRAVLPVFVALLVAVFSVRFGIRALRGGVTFSGEVARGGRLFFATVWSAWVWFACELFYRQVWLGWASVFGNVGASLVGSALAVALLFAVDSFVPWSRAARGVQKLGLFVLAAVALATAHSAWSHREVVSAITLIPVALVGLGLMVSGLHRMERDRSRRTLVELGLASTLLAGPVWRFLL